MAYKAEYNHNLYTDSDSKKIHKWSLGAYFNFWKETPPKDRKIIRGRMKDFLKEVEEKEKNYESITIPEQYILRNKSDYEAWYRTCYGGAYTYSFRRTFSLKFYLYFNAEGDTLTETNFFKIIELDGINDYILTGKKKGNN